MYKFIAYIPDSHLEAVKAALFAAGAGQYGGYCNCCWQVQGIGQFCAQEGTKPFLGAIGKTEQVAEWRVEMIAPKTKIAQIVTAYRAAHPYEVAAFDVLELLMF